MTSASVGVTFLTLVMRLQHNNSWRKIGQILRRPAEQCRDTFRHRLQGGGDVGDWTPEQEDELEKAMINGYADVRMAVPSWRTDKMLTFLWCSTTCTFVKNSAGSKLQSLSRQRDDRRLKFARSGARACDHV